MTRKFPLHPFLFALFPVLFLYSHNIGEVPGRMVWLPLVLAAALALAVWLLSGAALRDGKKAALVASLFVVLFFSFGHAHNRVSGTPYVYLIYFLWPAAFLAGGFLSVRTRRDLANLTGLLNAVSAILVFISLANIGVYAYKERDGTEYFAGGTNSELMEAGAAAAGELPDIYFIVLDGYGRADMLEEIYGLDNSDFLGFLSERGFYVAERSIANYCQTGLAFSSILNFEYLDAFVSTIGETSQNRDIMNTLVAESRLLKFLKKRGYTVAAFESGRPETELKGADLYLTSGRTLNIFQVELINTTPVPLFTSMISAMGARDQIDQHRDRILYILKNHPEMTEEPGPTFVFAHVEAPHPPFVFGPDGEKVVYETTFNDFDANWLIRRGRLTFSEYLKAYAEQVTFINKEVKKAVEGILSRSERPPVIIILGDHGPRSMLVWHDPDDTFYGESLTNLSAFYLPGGATELLYEEISPVNVFRIVLNRYFGTDLEVLPDRSFFSTAYYLYKFIDVTDKVRNPDYRMMHRKFGNFYFQEDRLPQAAEHLRKALEFDPGDGLVHNNLGVVYFRLRDYKRAYTHFSEALRLLPEDSPTSKDLKKTIARMKREKLIK